MLLLVCSVGVILLFGMMARCFGFNGPLRQYFSLYRTVSQRGWLGRYIVCYVRASPVTTYLGNNYQIL